MLRVCLLVGLQSMSAARAYEADIHYSTTYVLARAVGWTEPEALTIASANQGVDENEDTVAALEMDAAPGSSLAGLVANSLRQAQKNLRFHCFSKTRSRAGEIPRDVLDVISGHLAEVPDDDADPRKAATRMIALGVALHCQQDAYAHVDFGGACGAYPGNCYGHTHRNLFDQAVFRVLGKHYFNPDHPGVSGKRLLETLQGTAHELAARRAKASYRPIASSALVSLADALRGSGLKLPDEVRLQCNRYIAGKWLFDFFDSAGRSGTPEQLERLSPAVAETCRNASLAATTIVRIPAPRFPHLTPDATPHLVRSDGTYRVLPGNIGSRPGTRAIAIAHLLPDHEARVQLSHWRQLLALRPWRQITLRDSHRD